MGDELCVACTEIIFLLRIPFGETSFGSREPNNREQEMSREFQLRSL